MSETTKILSIIAYYLSEYDMDAVAALGYSSRKEAFEKISALFKHENNYLKLRRDEFDALPNSSSRRNGWKNRTPVKAVVDLSEHLQNFTFDELTDLVKALIDNSEGSDNVEMPLTGLDNTDDTAKEYSEEDLEQIINFVDNSATVRVKTGTTSMRVYNPKIIQELKKLYLGTCQLCNERPLGLETDICEAHHINPFAKSCNNNASNIIILCPNHHREIHKLKPMFDYDRLTFIYQNGREEPVLLNHHL